MSRRGDVTLAAVMALGGCGEPPREPASSWLVGGAVERVIVDDVPDWDGLSDCDCRLEARLALDEASRSIVYVAGYEKRPRLVAVPVAGGTPVLITPGEAGVEDTSPFVSRGGALAWVRAREKPSKMPSIDIQWRPTISERAAERSITDDGLYKTCMRFLPDGRHLVWRGRRAAGGLDDPWIAETLLADLESGTIRRLGPRASGRQDYAVSADGRYVATISQEDEDCVACRLYGGFAIVRLFEVETATQRFAVEGAFDNVSFSRDATEMWLTSASDLFLIAGAPVVDERGPGLYAHRIGSRRIEWRAAKPMRGRITPIHGGAVTFEEGDRRLTHVGPDSKPIASFEEVVAWVPASDGTAFLRMERRGGKLTIIARAAR